MSAKSGRPVITRVVWILSLVSLFTDIASEMLYPVMPVYLQSIGFTVFLIGILEGLAEAVAGLSKGYFGRLSDHTGQRVPFIRLGYSLSAVSKPLMAVFTWPLWVLGARTLDRLGKGLRTGARDAMLSAESRPEHKGKVFGLHRGMDTLGAAVGPLVALAFLAYYPQEYRWLFYLAFIPGCLGVTLTLLLRDKNVRPATPKWPGLLAFIRYLKEAPRGYKKLLYGLWFFTFFNSSDIFLLLMVKHAGLGDLQMIGVYVFYNLVYALFSYPLGALGDRIGLKPTLLMGLALFSTVYFGMAMAGTMIWFFILFFAYGVYSAATESIAKAWIANLVPTGETATAIGTYEAFRSIAILAASIMAGSIWMVWNPQATFIVTGCATLIAAVYLLIMAPAPINRGSQN